MTVWHVLVFWCCSPVADIEVHSKRRATKWDQIEVSYEN
jgi:hypothetical protein